MVDRLEMLMGSIQMKQDTELECRWIMIVGYTIIGIIILILSFALAGLI